MYKLKDLQGTNLKSDRVYKTKEEVKEDLLNYHAPDLEEGNTYELGDLLEIGEWDLLMYCKDCNIYFGSDDIDPCDIPY